MFLTGKEWENYSTQHINDHNSNERQKICNPFWQELKLETVSVQELISHAFWMKANAERNHQDISNIPVFLEMNSQRYLLQSFSISPRYNTISLRQSDRLLYTAPDARPDNGGEYWASRGPGQDDCSGFIKSKLAGERIRRMVRYILDKDDTNSWLDYSDYEPEWIQFKFSADEFDVDKLDKMSRDNNGIITEHMLRECVLPIYK